MDSHRAQLAALQLRIDMVSSTNDMQDDTPPMEETVRNEPTLGISGSSIRETSNASMLALVAEEPTRPRGPPV